MQATSLDASGSPYKAFSTYALMQRRSECVGPCNVPWSPCCFVYLDHLGVPWVPSPCAVSRLCPAAQSAAVARTQGNPDTNVSTHIHKALYNLCRQRLLTLQSHHTKLSGPMSLCRGGQSVFVLATCLGCCVVLFVILTISRSRGYRLPVLHHVCVLQPRVLPLLVGPCAVLGQA